MIVQHKVLMQPFSNMKIGGIAKSLIYIEDEKELLNLFSPDERYFVLGNGTNVLLSDDYLDINFISLKKLNTIKKLSDTKVYAEAGANLSDFISFMKSNDLGGLENITGIPGSIGGLVNMNGGAYGTTIFDKISSVKVLDENHNIKELSKNEIKFNYRTTEIKEKSWVVISAIFELEKGFNKEKSEEKVNLRKQNHPLDYPNLGSTFKNPKDNFAAQLISDCGLKEYTVGDMQVSAKHPNFLINKGNAKFADVIKLINHIKKTVYEKTNIMLETEIIILK